MKYENRTIPEGINVSSEHPLKEFFILAIGLGLATIITVIVLSVAAGKLAHYIPFSVEKKLATSAFSGSSSKNVELTEDQQEIQHYLQQLANALAIAQKLPEDMDITVHYIDDDTMNAFATMGGNIIMYRGLIERLPHENALSMLTAHEIAHIKHRAPIVSIGRGITVGLALASVTGFGDSGLSQQLVGNISLLTSLTFSRSQEEEADLEALKTLEQYYGHTNGAQSLFEILQQSHEGPAPPELLSTHPLTLRRIKKVTEYNKRFPLTNNYQPLPDLIERLKKKGT